MNWGTFRWPAPAARPSARSSSILWSSLGPTSRTTGIPCWSSGADRPLALQLPLALLASREVLLRCGLFYLFQFFAGFCLIANGVYLGVGSFGGVGDAGDLLRHGSPPWMLIAFGLVSAAAGMWLWNGLGPHYGLGKSRAGWDRRAVRWAFGLVLTHRGG